MLNIEPIKLLKGSHADTAQTGQGCFMNVIAYLNGEPQITDQSPCVCVTVRPLAIRLNDTADDEQRQRLLPFVMRAMGSATKDKTIFDARFARLRQYGAECKKVLNTAKAALAKFPKADAYAYAYAKAYADAYAYADADAKAKAQIKAIADGVRHDLFEAGLRYLDDVLPPAEPVGVDVIARAQKLVELAAA